MKYPHLVIGYSPFDSITDTYKNVWYTVVVNVKIIFMIKKNCIFAKSIKAPIQLFGAFNGQSYNEININ